MASTLRLGNGGDLAVAGIFTQLAIGSGQKLKRQLVNERNPLVSAHTRIAEDIRPWLLLFFVALGALLVFERRLRTALTAVSLRNPLHAAGRRDRRQMGPRYATTRVGGVRVWGWRRRTTQRY